MPRIDFSRRYHVLVGPRVQLGPFVNPEAAIGAAKSIKMGVAMGELRDAVANAEWSHARHDSDATASILHDALDRLGNWGAAGRYPHIRVVERRTVPAAGTPVVMQSADDREVWTNRGAGWRRKRVREWWRGVREWAALAVTGEAGARWQ